MMTVSDHSNSIRFLIVFTHQSGVLIPHSQSLTIAGLDTQFCHQLMRGLTNFQKFSYFHRCNSKLLCNFAPVSPHDTKRHVTNRQGFIPDSVGRMAIIYVVRY